MEDLNPWNRDSILAKFQAVTSIDDFETCISILEPNDWDLDRALTCVFNEDDIHAQSINFEGSDKKDEVVYLDSDEIHQLKFIVYYDNNVCIIEISENDTVSALKRKLFVQCGFQEHKMIIEGLVEDIEDLSDYTILSSLNLCKETKLYLHKKSTSNAEYDQSKTFTNSIPIVDLEDSSDITLLIQYNDLKSVKEYILKFKPTQTIQDVKEELLFLTKIPPSNQIWQGWPSKCLEKSMLGNLDLKQPYQLYMSKCGETLPSSSSTLDFEEHIISDDDEIFEDAPAYGHKSLPLLPPDSNDDSESMIIFQHRFEERYRDSHPVFFLGSLQEAMVEAEGKNIFERKPLLIYLHHDQSVFTNIFCSQIMCSEQFATFVTENFVFWGWDVTHESNKIKFVNMMVQHFGGMSVSAVTNYEESDYPLLVVVSKSKSAAEICLVLQANTSLDEVMSVVISAYETAKQSQDIELKLENDRFARDAEKQEQDAAFYASLSADKAKAAAEQARLVLERQKDQEAQSQEKERKKCLEKLPTEPGENEPNITSILFRFPGGERVSRRFRANETMQVMYMYLSSKGFNNNSHRFVTNFPKRMFTNECVDRTFEEMKLVPRESIFVEEI
uniref:FAS-associated factor 1 n=1 Tax=Hydra vulgaris TaxID=6087 RepID=T2M3U7_HYDVU